MILRMFLSLWEYTGVIVLFIHTTQALSEGVAEVSQLFLRDAHVLPKYLTMSNTADVTGGKPIAVLLQSISGVSVINP
jgi:hypothetical protein